MSKLGKNILMDCSDGYEKYQAYRQSGAGNKQTYQHDDDSSKNGTDAPFIVKDNPHTFVNIQLVFHVAGAVKAITSG